MTAVRLRGTTPETMRPGPVTVERASVPRALNAVNEGARAWRVYDGLAHVFWIVTGGTAEQAEAALRKALAAGYPGAGTVEASVVPA